VGCFLYFYGMLLRLENAHQDDVQKLLEFARENELQLSLVDDTSQVELPGRPLTSQQLQELIEKSRSSGTITMESAHELIRKSFDSN
jgi:hypothetical protein